MTKFTLNYYKPKKVALEDLEKEFAEKNGEEATNPFIINQFQNYHPIYKQFFELTESNYNSVGLNHRFHMSGLNKIWDSKLSKSVDCELFIKFAPLLDPVRYLIGRYKANENFRIIPNLTNQCHEKLASLNNASYIDNFFYYLSSQLLHEHGILNGIDYYGSFMGVQKKFRMNLADDIDYLTQSEYFIENRGKLYDVEESENPFANFGSRNNKNKLMIHNESSGSIVSLDDIEEIEPQIEQVVEGLEEIRVEEDCVYEKSSETYSSENTSNNSELNYSDDDDENKEGESEGEDEDEDEGSQWSDMDSNEESVDGSEKEESIEVSSSEESEIPMNAFIYDFPVQMICLEKCKGTLDRLFVKKTLDIDTASSALLQVIMTLYAYQKAFNFTHNDLHTNNIMYVDTEEENLYYKINNTYYKLPTYGRLFKLIDFGRAIYKFQGHTFCSDSFSPGGDASTQYNCEPYFNKKKPRLDPNYSFDICRLGCSIYDFLLDIEDENDKNFEPDELQKLIIDWVTDDNGKNVLYMTNGEERYPNFKLYKMIARTVHNKTPEDQLKHEIFKEFIVTKNDIPEGQQIIDLDAIPSYI
jgi:hypothetical protein